MLYSPTAVGYVFIDNIRRPLHDRLVPDPTPESAFYQLLDAPYLDFDLDPVAGITGVRKSQALGHENGAVSGQLGADNPGHETRQISTVRQRSTARMYGIGIASQTGKLVDIRSVDTFRYGYTIAHR